MRKILLAIIFVICFSCVANAEMPVAEGFGGFRWGTTMREFLIHFPTAEPLYKSGGEVQQIFKVGEGLYGFEHGKFSFYQKWITKEEFDRTFKQIQKKYGSPNEVNADSDHNHYGWTAGQRKELRITPTKCVNLYLMWYRPGVFPFNQGGVLYVSLIEWSEKGTDKRPAQ